MEKIKVERHQDTLELSKAIQEIHRAKLRIEVLEKDLGVAYKAKKMLKDWIRMLKRISIDFSNLVGNNTYMGIINKELLNDEDSLQIDAIVDNILMMNKEDRDKMEQYIDGYYISNYK